MPLDRDVIVVRAPPADFHVFALCCRHAEERSAELQTLGGVPAHENSRLLARQQRR